MVIYSDSVGNIKKCQEFLRLIRWRNELQMQNKLKNTETVKEIYGNADIESIFELNQGNHFRDFEERMAKGIAWILSR